MIDFKTGLQNVSHEWQRLAQKRISQDTIEQVKRHVEQKLQDMRPSVSFYGAYNAGKSTLLNALFSQELAAVGDTPETYRITEYKWQEWSIFDTPGIDAPIEHEKETNRHIRECECILFVVSSIADWEHANIHEKIAELVRRNKPLFLIHNDKEGILSSPDEKERNAEWAKILSKIKENLDKTWNDYDLRQYRLPEPYIVNAKSALKAKLEEKGVLLEKSRLPSLEEAIQSFLRRSGAEDVINALVDYFQPHLESLAEEIGTELKNDELAELRKSERRLETEKKRILYEAETMLSEAVSRLIASLIELEPEALKAQAQSSLEQILRSVSDYMEGELTKVAETYEKDTRPDVLKRLKNLPDNQLNLGDSEARVETALSGIDSSRGGLESTIELLGKIPILGSLLGKVLGPVIQIFLTFFGGDTANSQQQQYVEEQKQKARMHGPLIGQIRSEISRIVKKGIESVAETFFQSLFEEMQQSGAALQTDNKQAEADDRKLTEIKKSLDALKVVPSI